MPSLSTMSAVYELSPMTTPPPLPRHAPKGDCFVDGLLPITARHGIPHKPSLGRYAGRPRCYCVRCGAPTMTIGGVK